MLRDLTQIETSLLMADDYKDEFLLRLRKSFIYETPLLAQGWVFVGASGRSMSFS
jgi:hypothetical protein